MNRHIISLSDEQLTPFDLNTFVPAKSVSKKPNRPHQFAVRSLA